MTKNINDENNPKDRSNNPAGNSNNADGQGNSGGAGKPGVVEIHKKNLAEDEKYKKYRESYDSKKANKKGDGK